MKTPHEWKHKKEVLCDCKIPNYKVDEVELQKSIQKSQEFISFIQDYEKRNEKISNVLSHFMLDITLEEVYSANKWAKAFISASTYMIAEINAFLYFNKLNFITDTFGF